MKGLTPQELLEVQNFVHIHHCFGWVKEENRIKGNLGYCIKYIDTTYDSRTNTVWIVTFRGGYTDGTFSVNGTEGGEFATLFEWVMAFLNYDWVFKGK